MLGLLASSPLSFLVAIIGLLISITIHEFSHAFVADKLGDPTPRIQDRLTLNPLAHLDPLGTIAMIVVGFGWGKPVQFDPYNLKNPVRDGALIALAGPTSNLILASLISVILHSGFAPWTAVSDILQSIAYINIVLAVFNLVPIHPLDGSKIVLALLPRRLGYEYESFMNKSGLLLLIFILLPVFQGQSLVSAIISPVIGLVAKVLGLG